MTPERFRKALTKISEKLPGSIPYDRQYQINIKKELDGFSLPEVYRKTMPHVNDDWETLIESGKIKLEGHKAKKNTLVKGGQITTRIVENVTEPAVSTNIKLLASTQDYWVLYKPSPLPVHGAGRFYKNTLIYFLETCFRNKKFHLVHRLDANTTGLIIVALNKRTANYFIDAFKNKKVIKEYVALVEGKVRSEKFSLKYSIGKESEASGSRSIKDGVMAETAVELLKHRDNLSLLRVIPSTGRTNQIRLHLAHAGLPIKGDSGYKDKEYFRNNPMTYPDDTLYLHAHKLTFKHPESGEKTTYTSPIPDKFSIILE